MICEVLDGNYGVIAEYWFQDLLVEYYVGYLVEVLILVVKESLVIASLATSDLVDSFFTMGFSLVLGF